MRTSRLAGAASIHRYTPAFHWAAGIFALALLLALTIRPSGRADRASEAGIEVPRELALRLETTPA